MAAKCPGCLTLNVLMTLEAELALVDGKTGGARWFMLVP